MSYGSIITNDSNEILIDGESPLIQVVGAFSLTGVLQTSGQHNGRYLFDSPSLTPPNMVFVKLPDVGDYAYNLASSNLTAYRGRYYSNRGSLDFIVARNISQITAPGGGYGMEVYNSLGVLTFSSNSKLLICDRGLTLSPPASGAAGQTVDITLKENYFNFKSYVSFYYSGAAYAALINGLRRSGATQLQYYLYSLGAGPNVSSSPRQMSLITARGN